MTLHIRNLAADRRGNAIVEFSLIAPMIAGVIALIGQGAVQFFSMHNMRNAVHSGAQYVMGGSRSINDIRAVVNSSWSNRPEDSAIAITQFFKCGSQAGTEGVLCSDNKLPAMYFKIRSHATFEGLWDNSMAAQEVVRVR